MKITITREFTTASEAMEFLARVQGPSPAPDAAPNGFAVPPRLTPLSTITEPPDQPAVKKPRKGRSDAGQPRGPYKTTGAAAPETACASQPTTQGRTASTVASAPAAASTIPAAPAKSSAVEPPQAASAPAAADWTLETVRAEMAKLHALPNKGTTACLAALKHFGTARISDLPKEKYAEFVKYVHEQIAA